MRLLGHLRSGLPTEKSGISVLRLFLDITNQFQSKVVATPHQAEFRVGRSALKEQSAFIGYANVEVQASQEIGLLSQTRWTICMPLLQNQIQRIEDVRKGGDLILFITIPCTLAIIDQSSQPTYPPVSIERVQDVTTGNECCTLQVAESDWVKILEGLGYGHHYVIEVPLRDIPRRAEFERAVGHLDDAWEQFEECHDDDTLVDCYRVFEHLAKKRGFENADQNAFEKLLDGVEDPEKRKYLKALFSKVCKYFQLGRYESGKDHVRVDRRDSEFALILATVALSYLAKTTPRPRAPIAPLKKRSRRPARLVGPADDLGPEG